MPTMLQPQVERAFITVGVILCVGGALAVAAGAWSASSARQFQATAVRTTATVIPSGHPHGAVRFTTDRGDVVEASMPQGHSEPVGSTVKILYEPGNPHRWMMEPGYGPGHGLGVVAGGAAMVILGVVMATAGRIRRWLDHRRSGH